MKKHLLVAVALAALLPAATAHGQATRTWVSGAGVAHPEPGDDANPCSRVQPCKTFAGAISKTTTGGEINTLTSGGFGAVTITKSITIDGAGTQASILSSGIDAINITIPTSALDPQRRVVLRNLSINGAGPTLGTLGVDITGDGAAYVELQNVRISNVARHGVHFRPTTSADARTTLVLDNVTITNVGGNAVNLVPLNGLPVLNGVIHGSALSAAAGTSIDPVGTPTGAGILADTGSTVQLSGTTIFGNKTGLRLLGSSGLPGVIASYCDNQIAGNDQPGDVPALADTPQCAAAKAPAPTPAPTPAPVPTPTVVTKEVLVPAPEQCRVPNLKGLTQPTAKRFLVATGCALGAVKKKKTTKKAQLGTITAQGIKAGIKLPAGAKVSVTVGKR